MSMTLLVSGQEVLIDDDTYDLVKDSTWFVNDKGYAVRQEDLRTMQSLILPAPDGLLVDHKDRHTLNNQRHNLRHSTKAQNAQNAKSKNKIGKTSRFKGVNWFRTRWRATIRISGRATHLGYFTDEADAAKAYDASAKINFGEFARPNFACPQIPHW